MLPLLAPTQAVAVVAEDVIAGFTCMAMAGVRFLFWLVKLILLILIAFSYGYIDGSVAPNIRSDISPAKVAA